jgi:hypothetical protein
MGAGHRRHVETLMGCLALLSAIAPSRLLANGPNTVCVKVQLEIAQRLAFEADGFLASLRVSNAQAVSPIENLEVTLEFREPGGAPAASSFFEAVASLEGASSVDGSGTVAPDTLAEIQWLIVPTPGAGGSQPSGEVYGVRAHIQYRLGTEDFALTTQEESITVLPQPLLTLEYFLPTVVPGDDPFTDAVEAPEPYPLAVRVANTGFGAAKSLKVESAQPKIVDNLTGAAATFQILGAAVDGAPVQPSLAIEFGTIAPQSCAMGHWQMLSSLQGTFTSFDVKVSHKESLGGAKTSKIAAATTDFLTAIVQLDTPGKDTLPDLLVDFASSADGLPDAIAESECLDTALERRPAQMSSFSSAGSAATLVAITQPVVGWNYFDLADPTQGQLPVTGAKRLSDGSAVHPRNVWRLPRLDGSTPRRVAVLDFHTQGGVDTSYEIFFGGANSDTTPPSTTLVPLGPHHAGGPLIAPLGTLFALEATDPSGVAATFFSKDGGPETSGIATFFSAAGAHTLVFYSQDTAGNVEAPKSADIFIDAMPPSLVVSAPAAGASFEASTPLLVVASATDLDPAPTLSAELLDPTGGVVTALPVNAPVNLLNVGTGTYAIRVTARDWFGAEAAQTVGPITVTNATSLVLASVSPSASEPGALRELHLEGIGLTLPLSVELEGGAVESVQAHPSGGVLVRATAPATLGHFDVRVQRGALVSVLQDALEVSEVSCGVSCSGCAADVDCLDGRACTQDLCGPNDLCESSKLASCCAPPGECSACLSTSDVNGNGATNVSDVMCLVLLALWDLGGRQAPQPACVVGPTGFANVNCDGAFSVVDVQLAIGLALGLPLAPNLDANSNGCVDTCDGNDCGDGFCAGDETCVTCPGDCQPCAGSCCEARVGPGCSELAVQACVCAAQPACCALEAGWSAVCAAAAGLCGADCGGTLP